MALVITVVVLLAAVWPAMRIYEWRRGEAFRKACEQARVTQNWKQEELAAQAWLDYDPESGSAWVFLAEAAYELNELERSAEALGNVPEDDERALICYYEKANLEWTHLNKPLEGLETCERILALDSRVLEAHARVISFYALTLRRVEMLKAIRAAVESGAEPKESYTYLIMADNLAFTNASDLASRWMSSNPENQTLRVALAVQTALRLAMESEATAKIDAREMELEAVERLEEFLDVFPNDPVLLGFLLDHYTESGNVDRVEKLLGQIQEDGAEDHMLWVHRAWYYRQTEDYAQAEAACQRALELHPMSPAARIEYSQTLRLTGRVKEVEAFEALAVRGNELRKKLVQLQSARDVTGEQLELIVSKDENLGYLSGTVSPDGAWIAFVVADLERELEVFVQAFPEGGARFQVSQGGGLKPQWSPDGSELYFRSSEYRFMSASITTEPSFAVAAPQELFEDTYDPGIYITMPNYSVQPDGAKIVMVKPDSELGKATEIRLVLDWFAELERLVPTTTTD